MRIFNTTRVLAVALLISGLFWSCQKSVFNDLELEEHSAEFAFPLFSTDLLLKDLMVKVLNDTLAGDTIQINPDNTMTLFYSGDVAEKPATDLFGFLQNGLVPVPDTVYEVPFDTPDSVSISRVVLSGGQMNVVIANRLSEPVTGVFQIPPMTKNGVPYSLSFTVPPSNNFPFISPAIDLNGYELQSDSNSMNFRYEAYLPNGDRVVLPEVAPGTPAVGILFQNMTFSYLQGYWGYDVYPLTRDTIDIDINQTNLDGNVFISDPKINMTVINSWGFPTRGLVQYLSFIGSDGQEYKLESNIINEDSLDFNYPSFAAGEVGESKETNFYFDKNNSNIDEIFNAQPTQLIYEVLGISNARRDPSIIGFITDSSTIKLRLRVELVLEGSAKNFGAEQTLDLDFGEYTEVDSSRLEAIEFKLVTENSTPIATDLQVLFQDESGATIDSLFINGSTFVMEAAPVDANGQVTGERRTETFVPMSAERFHRVRNARKAYLRTAFTTAEDGTVPVKLLADQKATIKMGVKVTLRY